MKFKKLKNKKFSQHQKNSSFFGAGFTLIETLVYVVIFSLFVGSLVSFMNLITSSRVNNQITLEVNNQGNQAIRIITQSIRNATSIDTPSVSSSTPSLSLTTLVSNNNPTIFSISNGILFMTEGLNSPIALTNDNVVVSNLIFSNMSNPSTLGSVKVRVTLTGTVSNKSKSSNFYGSGTIKK